MADLELEGQTSLVSCKTCGKQLPQTAKCCPNCNKTNDNQQSNSLNEPLMDGTAESQLPSSAPRVVIHPVREQTQVVVATICAGDNCRNQASVACTTCNNRICTPHARRLGVNGRIVCIWCMQQQQVNNALLRAHLRQDRRSCLLTCWTIRVVIACISYVISS